VDLVEDAAAEMGEEDGEAPPSHISAIEAAGLVAAEGKKKAEKALASLLDTEQVRL
jgi:hypothetical protein